MHFGIRIVTYRRPDGSTKKNLLRTIDSVLAQSHTDWKVYLMGDRYDPASEFDEYASCFPKDKLFMLNNSGAVERDKYSGVDLWKTGGNGSMNKLMDIMAADGVEACACLDDDDIWYDDHLASLDLAYTKFPGVAFVYTAGYHTQSGFMPNVNAQFDLNNCPPVECQTLHSAASWNLRKIPLRYVDTVELGIDLNNDGQMWVMMREYMRSNGLDYVFVPRVTVWHDEHKPGCNDRKHFGGFGGKS